MTDPTDPTDPTDTTDPSADVFTAASLLVEEFVAALVNMRIYEITHPRVVGSLTAVRDGARKLASTIGEKSVRIAGIEGLLVFQRRPLGGASLGASRLLNLLDDWHSSGFEIDADVDEASLREFFTCLVARHEPTDDFATLNNTLLAHRARGVRLLAPYVEAGEATKRTDNKVRVGLRFYQTVIDLLQTVTVAVCRGGRIDFAPVQAQAEQVLRRLDEASDLQVGLSRHDQYDAFTFGHSMRVAILSMNFAMSLTRDHDLLVRIGTAALLHDVGKSLIPFEILHSTETLSAEERRQMDLHAPLGAQCLLDHRDADPLAVAAAFGHHRTPNRGGYPPTTHAHEVGLVTSIVRICDVYEALTAARPYKQPMSPIRAYRVMIAMGDKFDQRLLRRFIEVNGIYPVGQIVELVTGDVAIVREQGADPLLPKVACVDSAAGGELFEQEGGLLDLADLECDTARRILRELTPDEAQSMLACPRS